MLYQFFADDMSIYLSCYTEMCYVKEVYKKIHSLIHSFNTVSEANTYTYSVPPTLTFIYPGSVIFTNISLGDMKMIHSDKMIKYS